MSLGSHGDIITSLWFANAIGLVALLRQPISSWPLLLYLLAAAGLGANVMMGARLPAAAIVTTADMLEVWLVAIALQRLGGDKPWYTSIRWIVVFVGSATASSLVAATLGTAALFALGDPSVDLVRWRVWFVADTLGFLVVAPLLLSWTTNRLRDEVTWATSVEVALLTGLLSGVAILVFSAGSTPLLFLTFPFLMLVTFRGGLLGATAGVVSLALIATWATMHGSGPIAEMPNPLGLRDYSFQMLELYLLAAVLSVLPIAVILKERSEIMQHLDTALNNMARGLSMFDGEARLIMCNSLYREIYNLPESLVRPGTPLSKIIDFYVDRGGEFAQEAREQLLWLENHKANVVQGAPFSHMQHLKDGRVLRVSYQPLSGGGWVDLQEDITEKARFESKISHMALHDPLTDLPNRVMLKEALDQALQKIPVGGLIAFHLLDLDEFKAINDTHGHQIGDQLLKVIARRFRLQLRETDIIARMGGDEFAAVQLNISSQESAKTFAERLIAAVNQPYTLDSLNVKISASVGIALAPNDGESSEQLFKAADLALYQAKHLGRATYCLYDKALDEHNRTRYLLRSGLHEALETEQFELHYQPIVRIDSGEVTSVEALLRWRHPKRGLIAAGEFIPAAEESGLIVPLGAWVLNQACSQATTLPDHVKVAVNLSSAQFKHHGLVETVTEALNSSGLPASRLDIEITESVLIGEDEAIVRTLRELRDMGIGIALDDFGTGYSSLSYLQSFPFTKVKIDQSFIKNLTTNADTLKIVRAILMLTHSLGMTITAEGVETADQLELIRLEGCDEMQGYLVSKPLPASELWRLTSIRLGNPKHSRPNRLARQRRTGRSFGTSQTARRCS